MKEMMQYAREDYGAAMNLTQMLLGGELKPDVPELLEMFEIMHFWKDHCQKESQKENDPVFSNANHEVEKWLQSGIEAYSGYFLDQIGEIQNGIWIMFDRGFSEEEKRQVNIFCDFIKEYNCRPVWERLQKTWME